jgi:hypothetical protein
MLSALPAFVVGGLAVRGLGAIGINQISNFMLLMPVLICAWYYLIGWLLDHWISRRSRRRTPTPDADTGEVPFVRLPGELLYAPNT